MRSPQLNEDQTTPKDIRDLFQRKGRQYAVTERNAAIEDA